MATRMVVKKRSKLKEELLDNDKKVEKKTVKEEVATTPSEEVVVRRKKKKKSNKTENIVLAALIIILFACFAAIGFLFYKYFYAGASSNKYGDRLDGIENYPLSSTLEDDIKSLYSEEKSVNKVVVHIQGKIVYIDIDFSEAVKIETAESLASKSLEKIGEENLKFYDVQYILSYSGEEENENFPIFGAKKSTSTKIVWSKVK
jgi:hypothetical protein